MKRVILVVALVLIAVGFMMDGKEVRAENIEGSHYVVGTVEVVEGCYTNTKRESVCLGVVDVKDVRKAAKFHGDIERGRKVYKECTTVSGNTVCTTDWFTSVGEVYLQGGELN
ncbi:hypothetical protein D5W64_12630 [Salmonella enterica subsp. enterica serovar Saintpaul]|nr:hypothetical protein [Salmonella enterica subsp. enterica serovar Saintpaul]